MRKREMGAPTCPKFKKQGTANKREMGTPDSRNLISVISLNRNDLHRYSYECSLRDTSRILMSFDTIDIGCQERVCESINDFLWNRTRI